MQPTQYPTLAQSLWPTSPNLYLLRPAALVLLGTMALAVSAKIQVPFYPVPMTMQTLVVLILSAIFGVRLACLTVVVYLIEGASGLPVFASGSGLAYLVGPTAGFLAGFLAAAAAVGYAAEKGFDRSFAASFAVMSLGHAIIFCFGFAWLSLLFGPAKAWAVGVAPFIAATVLKTIIAALFVPALWRLHR
jgi:biotin transport system substrate-specific component